MARRRRPRPRARAKRSRDRALRRRPAPRRGEPARVHARRARHPVSHRARGARRAAGGRRRRRRSHHRGGRMMRRPRGFTLIEILIAGAILAIALAATTRAAGVAADGAYETRQHLLATWAVENRVAELRARRAFADPATTRLAATE